MKRLFIAFKQVCQIQEQITIQRHRQRRRHRRQRPERRVYH